MTVIEFNFNDDWMGEISRRLGDLNDKTPDVISQATNSTARKARKLIVQSLREHYAEDAKTKEPAPAARSTTPRSTSEARCRTCGVLM